MSSRKQIQVDVSSESTPSPKHPPSPKHKKGNKKKPHRDAIPEGEGNYVHVESRSGEEYNAIVPKWEFGKNQNTNPSYRELSDPKEITNEEFQTRKETLIFIPGRMADEQIDDLVTEGHKIGIWNKDLIFELIHNNNYDYEKAKKAILDYPLPIYHPFLYPYFDPPLITKTNIEIKEECPYSPHIFDAHPISREAHSNRWGLAMLKRLNIDTSFLKDYFNKSLIDDDVCGICGEPGYLIICDGPCKQSYHLTCLHLKKNPSDDLYICPICRYNKYKQANIGCYDIQHNKITMKSILAYVYQYEYDHDLNEDVDISLIQSYSQDGENSKKKETKNNKQKHSDHHTKTSTKRTKSEESDTQESEDEYDSYSDEEDSQKSNEHNSELNMNVKAETTITRSGRKVIPRSSTDRFNLYYTNKGTRRHHHNDSEESSDSSHHKEEKSPRGRKKTSHKVAKNRREYNDGSENSLILSENSEDHYSSSNEDTEDEQNENEKYIHSLEVKDEYIDRDDDDDDTFRLRNSRQKTKKLTTTERKDIANIVNYLSDPQSDREHIPCGIGKCQFIAESRKAIIAHIHAAHHRLFFYFKTNYYPIAFRKSGLNLRSYFSCLYPGCEMKLRFYTTFITHLVQTHKLDIHHFDVIGEKVDILHNKKHYIRIYSPDHNSDDEKKVNLKENVKKPSKKSRKKRRRIGDSDYDNSDNDDSDYGGPQSQNRKLQHNKESPKKESSQSTIQFQVNNYSNHYTKKMNNENKLNFEGVILRTPNVTNSDIENDSNISYSSYNTPLADDMSPKEPNIRTEYGKIPIRKDRKRTYEEYYDEYNSRLTSFKRNRRRGRNSKGIKTIGKTDLQDLVNQVSSSLYSTSNDYISSSEPVLPMKQNYALDMSDFHHNTSQYNITDDLSVLSEQLNRITTETEMFILRCCSCCFKQNTN